MANIRSDQLHQQQGGMSPDDFAAIHGLSQQSLQKLMKKGKILGASKHPLTKKWWIYPPAKLLVQLRRKAVPVIAAQPQADCEVVTLRAAPSSGAGAMVTASCGHAGTNPPLPEIEATEPLSGRPLLTLGLLGKMPDVFANRNTKEAVRTVKLAASQGFYPVVLSGVQLLVIERALLHEGEAIKAKLECTDEFESEARSATGEQLGTVYAALRILKQAVSAKHHADSVRPCDEVMR